MANICKRKVGPVETKKENDIHHNRDEFKGVIQYINQVPTNSNLYKLLTACFAFFLVICNFSFIYLHNNSVDNNLRKENDLRNTYGVQQQLMRDIKSVIMDLRILDRHINIQCQRQKLDIVALEIARADAIDKIVRINIGLRFIFSANVEMEISKLTAYVEKTSLETLCKIYQGYDNTMRNYLRTTVALMEKSIEETQEKLQAIGVTEKIPYTVLQRK